MNLRFGPIPAWAAPLVAASAVACEPWGTPELSTDPVNPEPTLGAVVLSPGVLEFGAVSALEDQPQSQIFTITNTSQAWVTVHQYDELVALEGTPSGAFTVLADPVFQLGPEESQDLLASFKPGTESDYLAELRINQGADVLRLSGRGTAPLVAVSTGSPSGVPVGCSRAIPIEISNQGSEPLLVQDAWISGTSTFLAPEFVPFELAPTEHNTLYADFAPGWDGTGGTFEAELHIQTNDPATPYTSVQLSELVYPGDQVTERFIYAPGVETDVLLLVDTGGVMAAHVDKGRAAVEALIDRYESGAVDYQAVGIGGASACPSHTPTLLHPDLPYWDILDGLGSPFDAPYGPGSDQLLTHALAALDQTGTGGCLEGFLREGAHLQLIIVAGTAESSGTVAGDLAAALEDLAPQAASVEVSVLIGTEESPACGVAYGQGYAEAALLTGGVIQDLCAASWEDAFERFGLSAVERSEGGLSAPLPRPAVQETLTVKADGITYEDWSYDAEAQALVFPAHSPPPSGSEVVVDYIAQVECPD